MDNIQLFVLGGTVVTFAIFIVAIYLAKHQANTDDQPPRVNGRPWHNAAIDNHFWNYRRGRYLPLASSREIMTAFQIALLTLLAVAGLAIWLLPRLIDAMFEDSKE